MKRLIIAASLTILIAGGALSLTLAQQPSPAVPPPPDPSAPSLTLEEKIALTTDDLKKQDLLDQAQKKFIADVKPIQDHQDAAKAAIEKEHDGWQLVLLGEGEVPVREMLATLMGHAYLGSVSVEWEKRWHPEIEAAELALPQHLSLLRTWLDESSEVA